ncbi:hypothetical protein D3C86_1756720 [compost metagenome]
MGAGVAEDQAGGEQQQRSQLEGRDHPEQFARQVGEQQVPHQQQHRQGEEAQQADGTTDGYARLQPVERRQGFAGFSHGLSPVSLRSAPGAGPVRGRG